MTETLTTQNPKSSAQQVKTQQAVIELVDKLLDDHVYSEIADILNQRGNPSGRLALVETRPTHASPTCGWPISSINTGFARAMTACGTAGC